MDPSESTVFSCSQVQMQPENVLDPPFVEPHQTNHGVVNQGEANNLFRKLTRSYNLIDQEIYFNNETVD